MLKNMLLRKEGNITLFVVLIIFISIALTPAVLADGEKIILVDGKGQGGFESGGSFLGNGWIVENGGETNRWEVGIAEPPGQFNPLRSAYISTDGGTTWGCNTTSASIVHFYRNILVPQDVEEIYLSFAYKGGTFNIFDKMQVYVVPPNTPIVAGTLLLFEPVYVPLPFPTLWLSAEKFIEVTPGTEFRLVFSWINETGSQQPPIAIDRIEVSCTRRNPLKENFGWQNPIPQGNHLNGIVAINPTTAITTGDRGTIGKTTDTGQNWNFNFAVNGIYGSIVSPIKIEDGRVFVIGQPDYFLKSSDGGSTFILQSQIGTGDVTIKSISNQLGTGNFVAAGGDEQTGGNGKIYRSTDDGVTWSNIHTINNTVWQDIEYTFPTRGSDGIIAGGLFGVYVRSNDNGATFVTPPTFTSNDINDFLVDPSDPSGNTIYAATAGGGVWKTTNFLTNDPNNIVWTQTFGANQNVRSMTMFDSQNGTAVGSSSTNGIIYTTQNGWNSVNTINIGDDDIPFDVAHYTSDKITVVGRSGLILNGFPTQYAYSSLTNSNVNDVEFINFINSEGEQSNEYGFAAGIGGVILATTNKGNEWTALQSGVTGILSGVTAKGFPPENLLVVGSAGQHVRSTDGGSTFKLMTIAPTGSFYDVKYTGTNSAVTVGDNGNVYLTTNLGANWNQQQSGITDRLLGIDFDLNYFEFEIGRTNNSGGDSLFGIAVGQNGRIIRTLDGGITWETKTSPTNLSLFAVDIADRLNAFAVGSVGVFIRTTDGGETWTQLPTNFNGTINSLSFISPTIGILSTSTGLLLRTLDGGETLDTLGSISNNNLLDVQMFDPFSATVVGGLGTIIHAEPDSIIIVGVREQLQQSIIPSQFLLEQNYPNPFNPTTTIKFALPKESFIKLEIFNSLGEKVSTLVSETLSAGAYEYELDAGSLSSGIYFYRLQSENFIQTKKLIFMK